MSDPSGGNARNVVWAAGKRLERVVSLKELLEGMIPEQNERMQKLVDVIRHWGLVVGPERARLSAPYEFQAGVLRIAATTPHAAQQIGNMKGNILRVLRDRWDLEVDAIRVIQGPPPLQARTPQSVPRRKHPHITLTSEEIEAFRTACPAALSEEAALGLARLRAFFARRFPRT